MQLNLLYLLMDKHEIKAEAMIKEIDRIICRQCSNDKTNIELAILQCKEQRNTLYRHNLIYGKVNEFEALEQVKFWDKVKEYLKQKL
jgi:hypothetical protein